MNHFKKLSREDLKNINGGLRMVVRTVCSPNNIVERCYNTYLGKRCTTVWEANPNDADCVPSSGGGGGGYGDKYYCNTLGGWISINAVCP